MARVGSDNRGRSPQDPCDLTVRSEWYCHKCCLLAAREPTSSGKICTSEASHASCRVAGDAGREAGASSCSSHVAGGGEAGALAASRALTTDDDAAVLHSAALLTASAIARAPLVAYAMHAAVCHIAAHSDIPTLLCFLAEPHRREHLHTPLPLLPCCRRKTIPMACMHACGLQMICMQHNNMHAI